MSATDIPEDALCIEDGCTRPAAVERLEGVVFVALDEDGFCWSTEWVCGKHGGLSIEDRLLNALARLFRPLLRRRSA